MIVFFFFLSALVTCAAIMDKLPLGMQRRVFSIQIVSIEIHAIA